MNNLKHMQVYLQVLSDMTKSSAHVGFLLSFLHFVSIGPTCIVNCNSVLSFS